MQTGMTIQKQTQALDHLVKLFRLDTLYHNHYLGRAKRLLQSVLPYETYLDLKRQKTSLVNLPNQIRNAMSDGNWSQVKDLCASSNFRSTESRRGSGLGGNCGRGRLFFWACAQGFPRTLEAP